jgi:hypothetical protein
MHEKNYCRESSKESTFDIFVMTFNFITPINVNPLLRLCIRLRL